jgi:hypothetical protein
VRGAFLSPVVHVRSHLAVLVVVALGGAALRADTIYQVSPRGRQVVVHRDAILIQQDFSSLTYKHFELKERRVVKVRLSQGSLPYSVVTSSADDRQRIVSTWKRFGFTAVMTDQNGKTTRVFDVYLDFYPPGGRGSLLESVPPRTTLPVLLEGGGADELDFSQIARLEFQGDRMRLSLRDGQAVNARFLMPTNKPAEARFLGITDQYDPASAEVFDFSVPLARLKEIRFEP